MKGRINQITILSLLIAISLALFSVELLLPPFPFSPGAKLGLSNTVTLFMVTNSRFFRNRDCFIVLILRCFLSAFLTGRILSIAFSLSGGIMAMVSMIITRRFLTQDSVVFISITGAVFHNMTQMLVAVLIYGTFSAVYYIPTLIIVGILCGVVIGFTIKIINKSKIQKFME